MVVHPHPLRRARDCRHIVMADTAEKNQVDRARMEVFSHWQRVR